MNLATELAPPVVEPLAGNVPAPRVAELLADRAGMVSRAADPLYVVRDANTDGLGYEIRGYDILYPGGFNENVIRVSEADALWDLEYKMLGVAGILRTYGADTTYIRRAATADKMRTDLRFIGRREFTAGAGAIAQHWLRKLDASKHGELAVAMTAGESSAYVFGAVCKALAALNPDAPEHIRVVDVKNPGHTARNGPSPSWLAEIGLIALEDWSISGEQTTQDVNQLAKHGIARDAMEVNLICGTDRHLQEGFDEVACKAYFVYPWTDKEDAGHVSITGAHCDTDYGFRKTLNRIMFSVRCVGQKLREEDSTLHEAYEKYPYPLLYKIARYYKPEAISDYEWLLSAEERAGLEAAHQEYGMVADRLRQLWL